MVFTFRLVATCDVALAVFRKSHSEPVENSPLDMSEMFTPRQRLNDKCIREESQSIDLTDERCEPVHLLLVSSA